MLLIAFVMVLSFLLSSCGGAFKPVTDERIPQVGWDSYRVEVNLGRSREKTLTASGTQVWRYGISRTYGWLSDACNPIHQRCLYVYIQGHTVTEVVLTH
jgi:hypothetical protein